jgi:hypothetical protein
MIFCEMPTRILSRSVSTLQIYYCVTLHPDDGKQNVLMAGCSDKKIYQFDIDTGDTVQVRTSPLAEGSDQSLESMDIPQRTLPGINTTSSSTLRSTTTTWERSTRSPLWMGGNDLCRHLMTSPSGCGSLASPCRCESSVDEVSIIMHV